MIDLHKKPRCIWLRSFYSFGPEDDGYIGWSEEGPRDRMLGLVENGDLFMIYGASSAETKKSHRNRVLEFLQVRARAIRDIEKASPAGMQRKSANGWTDKWTYAIPVVRAWRVDEPVLIEQIAPKTYHPSKGQAIAVWSPPLLPEEADLALKIKVTEVGLFGEPPFPETALKRNTFGRAFHTSRAFPSSFGERTAGYKYGPTRMYLARFDSDGFALLGQAKTHFDRSVLVKIGISNDIGRRVLELNAGFPPASIGRWTMQLISEPYDQRKSAETAEQAFKDIAGRKLQSLGGEFFRGDWDAAQLIFAELPGVARFGK